MYKISVKMGMSVTKGKDIRCHSVWISICSPNAVDQKLHSRLRLYEGKQFVLSVKMVNHVLIKQ